MVSCQLTPSMITTAEETATEGPRINDNHQDQEGDGQRIVDIGKKSFNLKKSFQSQITASLTAFIVMLVQNLRMEICPPINRSHEEPLLFKVGKIVGVAKYSSK